MSEDEAAVEVAPAPPHPRSVSAAAVSREPPTGGSPCRDWIDEMVDASIRRGPVRPARDKCPYCGCDWHGKPNNEGCQGSHLSKYRRKGKRPAVIQWDQM